MKYNPNKHHRRSIRLKGYDYSQAGLYFITICCQDMIWRFGKIENNEMILNECGQIAFDEWMKLTERFPNFELDAFQIMPNHIHAIIALNPPSSAMGASVGAALAAVQNDDAISQNDNIIIGANDMRAVANDIRAEANDMRAGASPARTDAISDIIGAYKSLVANGCLKISKSKNKIMGKFWQRNYYQHIIRNERAYQHISEYIINNPAKWQEDTFYKSQNPK